MKTYIAYNDWNSSMYWVLITALVSLQIKTALNGKRTKNELPSDESNLQTQITLFFEISYKCSNSHYFLKKIFIKVPFGSKIMFDSVNMESFSFTNIFFCFKPLHRKQYFTKCAQN